MEREHAALVAAAILHAANGDKADDDEETSAKVVALQQAIMRAWSDASPPMKRL